MRCFQVVQRSQPSSDAQVVQQHIDRHIALAAADDEFNPVNRGGHSALNYFRLPGQPGQCMIGLQTELTPLRGQRMIPRMKTPRRFGVALVIGANVERLGARRAVRTRVEDQSLLSQINRLGQRDHNSEILITLRLSRRGRTNMQRAAPVHRVPFAHRHFAEPPRAPAAIRLDHSRLTVH